MHWNPHILQTIKYMNSSIMLIITMLSGAYYVGYRCVDYTSSVVQLPVSLSASRACHCAKCNCE